MRVRIPTIVLYTAAQVAALLLGSVVAGFANVALGFEDPAFDKSSVEASIVYLGGNFIVAFGVFYVQALRRPERFWVEGSQVAAWTALGVTFFNLLTKVQSAWYWILVLDLFLYFLAMGLSGLAKPKLTKARN
jgi:hypothetical protein